MQAVIRAVDCAVPSRRMSNEEFTAFLDTSDEWIHSHTGIRNRHIADPDQAPSDLAFEACQKVLVQAGSAAERNRPDPRGNRHRRLPRVPVGRVHRAGPSRGEAGGSHGSRRGMHGVHLRPRDRPELRRSGGGARNVLVVGAEVLSPDRGLAGPQHVRPLRRRRGRGPRLGLRGRPRRIGPAEGAHRLDAAGRRVGARTCSSGPMGGTRAPFTPRTSTGTAACLKMDGRQVYNFAVKAIAEGIPELLAATGSASTTWRGSCPTRPTCGSSRPRRSARRSRSRSSS